MKPIRPKPDDRINKNHKTKGMQKKFKLLFDDGYVHVNLAKISHNVDTIYLLEVYIRF